MIFLCSDVMSESGSEQTEAQPECLHENKKKTFDKVNPANEVSGWESSSWKWGEAKFFDCKNKWKIMICLCITKGEQSTGGLRVEGEIWNAMQLLLTLPLLLVIPFAPSHSSKGKQIKTFQLLFSSTHTMPTRQAKSFSSDRAMWMQIGNYSRVNGNKASRLNRQLLEFLIEFNGNRRTAL